jgi:hypothetical protein
MMGLLIVKAPCARLRRRVKEQAVQHCLYPKCSRRHHKGAGFAMEFQFEGGRELLDESKRLR